MASEASQTNQAVVLRPYVGKWVALARPTEVLVATDTPEDVMAWLARHEQRANYGMFRVPLSAAEAEGAAPA
jgi:predicted DNA-binding ribbon-helix-helix protein